MLATVSERDAQTSVYPLTSPSSSLGNPPTLPEESVDGNPSGGSWVTLVVSAQMFVHCKPNQVPKPPQLAPLNVKKSINTNKMDTKTSMPRDQLHLTELQIAYSYLESMFTHL